MTWPTWFIATVLTLIVPSSATAATVNDVLLLGRANRVTGVVVITLPGERAKVIPLGKLGPGRGPVRSDTAFPVASISKVVNAAAIAISARNGGLRLDQDVRNQTPWLSQKAGSEPLTLRQLLTHTSGFEDRLVGSFARNPGAVLPLEIYLQRHLAERTTRPRQWTRYSNQGAALAGWLAARNRNLPYPEFIKFILLDRLSMQNSTFAQPQPLHIRNRLAPVYECPGFKCAPNPPRYRQAMPAGGFVTTGDDMARFIDALLAGPKGPLGAAAQDLLTQSWSISRRVPGMALALQEQEIDGARALVHSGGSSGTRALLAVVPESQSAIFATMSSGEAKFGAELMALFARLQRSDVGRSNLPWLVPAPVHAIPPASQSEYAGEYLLARAPLTGEERLPGIFAFAQTFDFDQNGWLVREEAGEIRRYGRVEGDLFGQSNGSRRILFTRDQHGRINGLQAPDSFFGIEYPASFLRTSNWQSPWFLNELLSWTLGVPPIALLLWSVTSVGMSLRRRKVGATAGVPQIAWAPILSAALATILVAIVGFGFVASFIGLATGDPAALAVGMPDSLSTVRKLTIPAIILTVLTSILAIRHVMRNVRLRVIDTLALLVVFVCLATFCVLLILFDLVA